MSRLRILAIEPYLGLSHKVFLEGYRRFSRHFVEIWSLPPRKWKWRMRGSAFHFAQAARTTASPVPDLVLATDYLNVADWRALAPARFGQVPTLLYFHENQATYPLSEKAPKDYHYGWINLSSALAADRVLFNSAYHREEFLTTVERVLDDMMDFVPDNLIGDLHSKSDVFPVGIDFDRHGELLAGRNKPRGDPPVIIWNHRWEYDKNPDLMIDALKELQRRNLPFRAILCGPEFDRKSPAFERAQRELNAALLHLGYYKDFRDYLGALHLADVILSTSYHEFFGVSIIEGLFMQCLPVLPRRLSYPEILPPHLHPMFLYDHEEDLGDFLAEFLQAPPYDFRKGIHELAGKYHWRVLAPKLDDILENMVAGD